MNFFKKALRPLIALTVLAILAIKGPFKFDQIKLALSQIDIIFLGLFLVLAQNIVFSIRWRTFVNHTLQNKIFNIWSALKLNFVGLFFSFFIPGGVGGDVVKALELSKSESLGRQASLSTVLADRILGLFSILFFAAISLGIEFFNQPTDLEKKLFFTSLIMFSGIVFFLFLSKPTILWFQKKFENVKNKFLEKIFKLIMSFELTTHSFRNLKILTKAVTLTLLAQIISISFMYYVTSKIHSHPPPFFVFFALCCFGFVASAIPITPAGIGVGQAAFYFMFSQIDESLGAVSITALSLYQIFQLFISLIGGLFFIKGSTNRKNT